VRYSIGQRVRVAARSHDGHHRTPAYVKGRTGSVVRAHGSFTNPETRAYGDDGLPLQPVYLVSFPQHDIWPGYRSSGADRLYIDLFEHWLEESE
jgi:nitrile hydratase beta subunit-like protein